MILLKNLIHKYTVFGPLAFVLKVNILFSVVWCPRGTCVESVHIVQTRSVLFFTPHRPLCPFSADTVLLSNVPCNGTTRNEVFTATCFCGV
jgi:hypothetical protein